MSNKKKRMVQELFSSSIPTVGSAWGWACVWTCKCGCASSHMRARSQPGRMAQAHPFDCRLALVFFQREMVRNIFIRRSTEVILLWSWSKGVLFDRWNTGEKSIIKISCPFSFSSCFLFLDCSMLALPPWTSLPLKCLKFPFLHFLLVRKFWNCNFLGNK